ncbi:MAG: glycosyltransferase family 25 protein [Alphaproteobacteria bacterium]
MNYAGYYINLDRRPDRRAEMEAELARYGLGGNYARFSAIEGNALGFPNPHLKVGEMGCFASHYKLLGENLGQDRHLHFVEDDTIFAPSFVQTMNGIFNRGLFTDYDIIYTDVWMPLLNDAYKNYRSFYDAMVKRDAAGKIVQAAFTVINMKGLMFGSTSSYFVNKTSIQKVYDAYAHEITHEPRQSIDLFIRKLSDEGELKVGCVFPFVTSVHLDHIVETDIARPYHEMSALAAHLGRYSFFIGADLNKCEEYLRKLMPLPPQPDQHTRILNHLLCYSMTDNYRAL